MQYAASVNENDLPADERKVTHVPKIIHSIDAYLLEVIAEDATIDTDDENFKSLVENLFATYQARLLDERQETRLKDGVMDLMRARRRYVLNKIPDGVTRKRYAQTGLSVQTSLGMAEDIQEIIDFLEANPYFSVDAFNEVVDYVHRHSSELATRDVEQLKRFGYIWITTGNYGSVFNAGPFRNIDQAVEYVEEAFCYEMPWVLNGFRRLVQQIVSVPKWFELLPDFLRYGVNQESLVWVLSLGFSDRRFAEWMLKLHREEKRLYPANFKELLDWILENRQSLNENIGAAWPHYFGVVFTKITDRYEKISNLLNQN